MNSLYLHSIQVYKTVFTKSQQLSLSKWSHSIKTPYKNDLESEHSVPTGSHKTVCNLDVQRVYIYRTTSQAVECILHLTCDYFLYIVCSECRQLDNASEGFSYPQKFPNSFC